MSVCVGVNANASALSEKEATRPQAVVVGIGTDDAAIQVHGEGAATQKMVVSRVSPLASTLQLQQIKLKLQGCAPHPSDPTTEIGHSTRATDRWLRVPTRTPSYTQFQRPSSAAKSCPLTAPVCVASRRCRVNGDGAAAIDDATSDGSGGAAGAGRCSGDNGFAAADPRKQQQPARGFDVADSVVAVCDNADSWVASSAAHREGVVHYATPDDLVRGDPHPSPAAPHCFAIPAPVRG